MKIPEPLPAEFEVATIKPTAPGVTGQNGRLQAGRLDLQNFTLKQMIQLAWELGNNDEFLVGLPKSSESEHWDVAGKAVSAGTADGQDIDFDTLRLMLQGLLAERFGRVHDDGHEGDEAAESRSAISNQLQVRRRPYTHTEPADHLPEHEHDAIRRHAAKHGQRLCTRAGEGRHGDRRFLGFQLQL